MKPRLLLVVAVAMGLVFFAFAQTAVNSTDKLESAAALLQAGNVKEARAMLATISSNDVAYPTARGLDALCLYQQDKLKFMEVMSAPDMQTLELPQELREELDYNHIDALFHYRNFEKLLPKLDEFAARHTGSAKLPTVTEYQTAALYERGMKKLTEAGFLRSRGDLVGAEKRLKEGQTNVGQFLRLSAGGQRDGYQQLQKRDAQAEMVKALTALGGEDEVLKQAGPEDREATALAILQLCIKTKPEAVDENLWRMTNFLNEFPNNNRAPRVRYEMAITVVEEGCRIAEKGTIAKAAPYLDKAYELFSGVVADKDAGLSEADVMESRKAILRVFYARREWARLSDWAAQNVAVLPSGGKDWLVFKLYDAYGLARMKKWAEAAAELDAMLAVGFKGNPSYDGLLASAAKWRIYVAKMTDDQATIQRMAELVENSNCYGSIKRTFAKDFEKMVAQPKPLSK